MMYQPKRVRRLPWFLLGAASTVFILLLIFLTLVSSLFAPPEVKVEPGTVMEIGVGGVIREKPSMGLLEQLTGTAGYSLWDIRRALEHAKDDDRIVGVRLNVGMLENGWATVAELQSYLDVFRSSGKPVYAYLGTDFIGEKEYAVTLCADKVWLVPGSAVFVDGLRAEAMFFRGTLDKLHVVPDLLALKEYKSAGETFVRKEMSEYLRESLTDLLVGAQDWFVTAVADRRSMEAEAIRSQINTGLMTAEEARAGGWVDSIGYSDEMESDLRTATGAEEYREISHSRYLLQAARPAPWRSKIAVVFGEGLIVAEEVDQLPFEGGIMSGPRIAAAIDAAVKDDQVKAIVFRINSGGGSAIGSDCIWRAIQRAHEADKPVVATMSDVAGSGGYWIAVGADKVIAHPQTVTGSIGVVMLKLNLRGFFELLGVTVDDVTLADNADMLSAFESMSDEQRALLRSWMEAVYEQFKQKVAATRALSLDEVEAVAKGRVWTGAQALERNLVDALGGIHEAISEAKRLADIPESEEVFLDIYPKPRTLMERLFAGEMAVAVFGRGLPAFAGTRLFADRPVQLPERLLRELSAPQPLALAPTITIR
jgi:protease-4